jgi:hypothetical protein
MLRFLGDGDGKYRLVNAGDREVGWIRGRVVGFRGFDSEERALAAAVTGAEALGAFLEQQTGRRHLPEPSGPLRLVHDGAHEWVSDGRIPVARLSRPPTSAAGRPTGDAAAGDSAGGAFAIEFVLPMAATEATAIHAAARVHAAVQQTNESRVGALPDEEAARCA